jgi:hypothetical protein
MPAMMKSVKFFLAWALLWLSGALTAAKAMADWFGRSRFIEDAEALGPKTARIFEWLAELPTPHFYAVPFILAGVGGVLLLLSNSTPRAGGIAPWWNLLLRRLNWRDRQREDDFAYNHLLAFLVDELLPACDAQLRFQEALVRHFCTDDTAADFAVMGLRGSSEPRIQAFWAQYDKLSSKRSGSPPAIGFDELIEAIHVLEDDVYRSFCHQIDPILDRNRRGTNIEDHKDLSGYREEWRQRHVAMVGAYRAIKRDIRFRKLIRPRRASRWGPPAI